jgi:NADH-quinone oxidoreductase subunit D
VTLKTEPFVVNIGPQHPSTHGVFRLRLTLDGERITDADMVMGYLHRSMEKLAEERTYTQNIPFTDRTDYIAAMTGNLAYVMAVEKLCGIEVPERALWLRTMMAELQRFASHCIAIGIFANDCGAWQTPVMHMFRDREKILDLFEMACGARLTLNYMRIGGVSRDIPPEFMPAVRKLLKDLPKRVDEYENLLLSNEIIVARSRGVGTLTPEQAMAHSVSGPMLRASGVAWDVRKADPYAAYDKVDFDMAVGTNGDAYDRFVVRLAEMRQSLRIIEQCVEMMPDGPVHAAFAGASVQPIGNPVGPLALRPPEGEAYARIESPRGELGFYIVSDGSPAPFRFHIRSPSFINLTPLKLMSVGATVADAIVILGSVDIVVGEVDR